MNSSNPLTPLEMLASQYRTVTHDTQNQLRQLLRAFIQIKNQQNSKPEPFLQMLSEGKEELLSLKRKLSQKFEEQFRLYDICKKRIHRHEQLKQDNEQRKKMQLNTQIIQYLQSRGQFSKAKELSKALKQEDMFQIQSGLLERAIKISQNILNNTLDELRQWIYENSHNLDKMQSQIYFEITCCQYINLIINGENIKACINLRNSIKDINLHNAQRQQIPKLTYLLIDPTAANSLLKFYLAKLEQTFKKCFSQIYLINFNSQLQRNIFVGISSLKTICCCKQQTKNEEICPICNKRANKLSQRVPMLTKQSSILKCRINHSIMNEENYPLALPNGNIYSVSGLNQTSKGDDYFCMNTQTWYPKAQAKKVYLA